MIFTAISIALVGVGVFGLFWLLLRMEDAYAKSKTPTYYRRPPTPLPELEVPFPDVLRTPFSQHCGLQVDDDLAGTPFARDYHSPYEPHQAETTSQEDFDAISDNDGDDD